MFRTPLPILLLLLFITGCAESPRPLPPLPAPVAILPFEGLGGEPEGGAILAEVLHQKLAGRVELVPWNETVEILTPLQGKVLSRAELGQTLGAATLVSGTVSEYGYAPDGRPRIGLTLRATAVGSGELLWQRTASTAGRIWLWHEETLTRTAERLMTEVAE